MMYVRRGQAAAPGGGGAGGEECGGGEEKRTPYGLKKPEFLAHLQDADPEH